MRVLRAGRRDVERPRVHDAQAVRRPGEVLEAGVAGGSEGAGAAPRPRREEVVVSRDEEGQVGLLVQLCAGGGLLRKVRLGFAELWEV